MSGKMCAVSVVAESQTSVVYAARAEVWADLQHVREGYQPEKSTVKVGPHLPNVIKT